MTGDQSVNLAYAVGGLILVGSALVARQMPFRQSAKMALAWVAIFAGVFVLFALRDDFGAIWQKVRIAATGDSGQTSGGAFRIPMAEDGHFWVRASVNGREVRFLVDSGATTTAMSRVTAEAAGVEIDDSGFPVMISTANGVVAARRARIATIEVGPIKREALAATVSPELGDMNLLGMNFLSSLKSWRVEGRTLVLEP